MQAAATLRLTVRPSLPLAGFMGAFYCFSAGLTWLLPWPSWLQAGISVVILASGVRFVWGQALRRGGGQVCAVEVQPAGQLLFTLNDGRRQQAELVPGSLVLPLFVILAYRRPGESWSRRLLLTADAGDPDIFRQLRVNLRHPRRAAGASKGAATNPGQR